VIAVPIPIPHCFLPLAQADIFVVKEVVKLSVAGLSLLSPCHSFLFPFLAPDCFISSSVPQYGPIIVVVDKHSSELEIKATFFLCAFL
jgi:hypothetical protein